MYVPKHFEQQDQRLLEEVIRQYPLAVLVVSTDSGLCGNHIPMRLGQAQPDRLLLQGHIAKANPLWQCRILAEVLAIFQGPNAYISPNWYPSKKVHGKVVPTWNYTAVHATGDIRFIHDRAWKLSFLQGLTDKQESAQEKPWAVSDAPPEFTEKMLTAIVGFEIVVRELRGKWKVSQNQSQENRIGVKAALSENSNPDADELVGFRS